MQLKPLLLYLFVVAPLVALSASVVGSIPVVLAVGQRWLLLLVAVPVVMIGAQVIELVAVVQTGQLPGTPGGEFVETTVNVLTAGAVYYGLTVTRDREALSERLSTQRDRHERLREGSLSPILVVRDETIIEANPAATDYFEAEELVDVPLSSLVAEEAWARVRERIDAVADGGEPERFEELPCRSRAGEERLAAVVAGPAEFAGSGAVQLDFQDLTEHREMSAELAQVRDRLTETFRNTNDAILFLDPSGREQILECNETAAALFGYDRDRLLETPPTAVYDPETLAAFADRVAAEDGYVADELPATTSDGETVPTEVSGSLTTLGDRETLLAIVRDVRDRRRRERRIRVVSRLLRHNLRNDMNVVLGHLEPLRAAAPPSARDHADRIRTVVDDLLDLSGEVQIAQDTLEDPTVTVLNARALLSEAAADARAANPDREPSVTVDAPAELAVRADQLLEVALRHLLDNAVEHADHDEPTVTASARRVEDAVAFTVADDGPGIPPVDRRVVTGDQEITAVEHVDGFGLWVVAWVTDTLDGTVTFRDNQPRGTVVELTVPDAAVDADETETTGRGHTDGDPPTNEQ